MKPTILNEITDSVSPYIARAMVKERAIIPGYVFYVEIQRKGTSQVKTLRLGNQGCSLDVYPVYHGVASVDFLDFDKEGLSVDFSKGIWGSGINAVSRKTKRVSRERFN